MSLHKGSVNFSVLRPNTTISTSFAEDLIGEAYKDGNPSIEAPVIDLSSGISLIPPSNMETPVSKDDFLCESLPFFAIRKRELKIDSSLFRETVARAVEEKKKTMNVDDINGKILKEIRAAAKDKLAANAAIKTSGTRAAYSPTGFFFVESSSVKKTFSFIEELSSLVPMNVLGQLNIVDFQYIAASMRFNASEYVPMRFSEHETTTGIGEDFLTWLLVASAGGVTIPQDIQLSIPGAIEMTDCSTSSAGAKIISMKEGLPYAGNEIHTCLLSGKKVSSLEMAVQIGQAAFEATVDTDFCIKKFKIAQGDEAENEETFTDRIVAMDNFVKGMVKLFGAFIETVKVDQASVETLIKTWITK